ncbi:MAG: DNA recombination protein RmuC [Saprospiraceae bacterium]|nr:DNA recombination protein RmuC [Saprospiraceae bacterium]
MDLTLILLALILLVSLSQFLVWIFRKPVDHGTDILAFLQNLKEQTFELNGNLRQEISGQKQEMVRELKDSRNEFQSEMNRHTQQQLKIFELLGNQVKELVNTNENRFNRLQDETRSSLEKIRIQVGERLEVLRVDNNAQLEKMRATVDEKLHQTLEERLGRSFRLVSDHLEKVQKGLGEMQTLAAGVGDLKKVLANVKTRGILGEIQLLNIIEEIMTKDQYDLNVAVVPGKEQRVEVAIKLPGNNKAQKLLYLPIDSKFPMDKYQLLCDAYESGCPSTINDRSKELRKAIIQAAKDIRTKYVAPPYTTDFAIMFLPVEGLYAEISRQGDLIHTLRTEYQILVAGPSNLSAFLSSLQMGFRTLAIEKRSSEVWRLLGDIKNEFGKFGSALEKVQKKLSEANNVIDQAGVRRRAIQRKLNKVEELPADSLTVKSVL